VIRKAHHQDRAKALPLAPAGKNRTFICGSGYIHRDSVDRLDAKRPQLSNRSCCSVFVRDSTADELAVRGFRRLGKNCNSRGYTAVNKVGRFEYPSAVGIEVQDDDVGGLDMLINDEHPSGGPQNRSSNGGYTNTSAHKHDYQHEPSPSPETSDHGSE